MGSTLPPLHTSCQNVPLQTAMVGGGSTPPQHGLRHSPIDIHVFGVECSCPHIIVQMYDSVRFNQRVVACLSNFVPSEGVIEADFFVPQCIELDCVEERGSFWGGVKNQFF